MSQESVLLIDADEVFKQLLQESLAAHGVPVVQVASPQELANEPRLVENAALILIAVDLPEKLGFRHFTEVRALAPRVPTVLVTASLPVGEFSLHAKLRLHANLYLDKRLLTQEIVARALAPLVPHLIPMPVAEPPGAPTRSGDVVGLAADERTRWLVREVSDEGLQALADAFPEEGEGDQGALTPARFARLSAELEQLRQELAESRRAAQSSPFSEEFHTLSEKTREQEAEITHLRLDVGHRDVQLADLQRQAEALGREHAAAVNGRDEALAACEGLSLRAAEAEQQALRLERTLQEQVERHASEKAELELQSRKIVEQQNAARERDRRQLQELRDREGQLRAAHEAALAELRKQHAREKASLRAAHEQQLQSSQRQAQTDLTKALERARTETEKRLAELQREHGRELAALRTSSDRELEAQKQALAAALSAAEREADRARSEAVESVRSEMMSRVVELERSHEEAMAALREEHARSVDEQTRALAAESKSQARALVAARAEFARASADAERAHANVLAELRREHEGRIEAVAAEAERKLAQGRLEATAELKRALAEHGRESATQLEDALARTRAQAEEQLEEARRAHAAELESLAQEARQRIQRLERKRGEEHAESERELERRCDAAAQAEREAGEARHEEFRQAQAQIVEALKRSHADELESLELGYVDKLESLRRSHAEEIDSLREAHASELAVGQQTSEATELENRSEHELLRRERDQLEEQLELQRADAERVEHELAKSLADIGERDSQLAARDREMAAARETLISLRAVLGDLERAIDSLPVDPSVAAGAASLLRSIVKTLEDP